MGLGFKIRFAFFCTCGSREQCIGANQKNANAQNNSLYRYLKYNKRAFANKLFAFCVLETTSHGNVHRPTT